MISLRDKDFDKLAVSLDIPRHHLEKLYTLGFIKDSRALDEIIYHDFHRLRRLGKYTPQQVVTAICSEYQVGVSKVREAIHRKPIRFYQCSGCGVRIRRCVHIRNNGLCDNCVAKTIEV